ncbi:unnamed protein product [Cyprideis torosa]|uniref:Uncharacterized protein n=1 Tax=Cyprideis torosa TaxID=163714 RepID=A0A7R8WA32_9CRUS|nr:unnamed protein product [Cyprideis torosa]CAG0885964.1 unnamed protein product [Cyprideis torosa]
MGEPLTSSTTAEETPPPAPRPSASSNMVTAIPAGTGQQQFCLRWNNYQSNLCSVFDQLLHAESFVDVTLACQGSKFIKCHRVVLSACSPYFQNLLLEHPVSHPIIILRDLQYPELQALVEFMYKGEINVLQEQIPRLLKTAEILRIRGLAEVKNDEDLKPSVGSVSNSSSSPQNSRRPVPIAPSPYPPHPSNEASRRNGVLPSSSTPPLTKRMRLDSSTVPSPLGNLFMLPPTGPHIGNPMFVGSGSNIHTSARSLEDEIKPGIAEMIKEEERARMMESAVSMANRGDGSPFSIDPMQYQVNSMWQKAWAQNQMTNYRFRERGPLKTWKPDTMAAAIKAVLNDGLSLSQAARSHDIPYPTFVLYANRVNNQLGPPPEGQGRKSFNFHAFSTTSWEQGS